MTQLQDEKIKEYSTQEVFFARKDAPGTRIKLQGTNVTPKPARIMLQEESLPKNQARILSSSPYF